MQTVLVNDGTMHLHYVVLQTWKSALGMHQTIQTAFGDNAMWRTQTPEWGFPIPMGKFWLKNTSVQISPKQDYTDGKIRESSQNCQ